MRSTPSSLRPHYLGSRITPGPYRSSKQGTSLHLEPLDLKPLRVRSRLLGLAPRIPSQVHSPGLQGTLDALSRELVGVLGETPQYPRPLCVESSLLLLVEEDEVRLGTGLSLPSERSSGQCTRRPARCLPPSPPTVVIGETGTPGPAAISPMGLSSPLPVPPPLGPEQ